MGTTLEEQGGKIVLLPRPFIIYIQTIHQKKKKKK